MSSLLNAASNVRENRASRLRAQQLAEKPQTRTVTWSNAPSRPGGFGKPDPCPPQGLPASLLRNSSRIPTRRVPGVRTSRPTSPMGSLRGSSPDRVSICSLPNHLEEKASPKRKALVAGDGDLQISNQKDKTSSLEVLNDQTDFKLVNKRVRLDLQPQHSAATFILPKNKGAKPSILRKRTTIVKTDRAHHRVLDLNKLRVVDVQQKKLENMQSEFMAKIRSLGILAKEHRGTYKFVAMVVNDNCKLVVHEDDMLRLPRNIPVESVNDLKHRCRNIVDTGFMMFYDFMPIIQHSKSDKEAQENREVLRAQLKSAVNRRINSVIEEIDELCRTKGKRDEAPNSTLYREMNELRVQKTNMETRYFDLKKELIDQINQQKADCDAKMAVEISVRDHKVSELRKSLRRSEDLVAELNIRLSEKDDDLKTSNQTILTLQSENDELVRVNNRIQKSMEDTNLGLERANKTVANLEEKISYLRDELKEARELIVNLQKRPDPLDDKSMGEKDVIIADLKLQLQNFEHHRNMMQKQVNAAVKQVAEFDELNAKYQSSATQLNELREQLRNSEAKRIIHARNEEQLRKDLEKLRDQSSRDQKMLSLRSDMINDLQDNERDCQLKIDKIYKEITSFEEVKKNLTLKEKEFRNLFGTLTFKQKELRRQDHAIKLMKEENSRIISRQTKQKERNTAMQAEIINLKKIIFKYAKLVIGTNGQKSFEVVPDLEDASINAPRLQPQPHPHPPQRRHRSMSLSHGRSFFDPLQRFHEQQQKLLQRQRRSTDSPRRMHQHNQEDRQQNPLNIPAPQQHSSQQNNQLNHHLHRRHRRHHRN
ncbi:uncharacterized protein MCAP_0864-like isoform X1 [Drosophila bipectinata]|uniref:uncharacterized protein MCAP_0864-like isoform X1 n=1 Tax=Drosophila bipectinata TaxID=42026 RepID=UPI0038B2FA55